MQFLPAPSARRATAPDCRTLKQCCDFYPRPPRGGRHRRQPDETGITEFLPTPSARRATSQRRKEHGQQMDFYPRPPRGGRRLTAGAKRQPTTFLPTPSARRATASLASFFFSLWLNFYPRPPRGGRQQMCHKIKAIFWQHLYDWIQLTKRAGCIYAGCTICESAACTFKQNGQVRGSGGFSVRCALAPKFCLR